MNDTRDTRKIEKRAKFIMKQLILFRHVIKLITCIAGIGLIFKNVRGQDQYANLS